MNEQKISFIERKMLHPHPENPRKDLGDLEELRESIRENGIMQNLTVVPDVDGDGYMILIGHRRFAASEGIIDELPCVIADHLTEREQVGIMLAENMQRSDLTFIEQAHGFQLMMDLGDTVESISKKTGFSKQTIKHRLEISKLDKNIIETAQKNFQLSIGDFIELEKVKDLAARNDILEVAENSEDIRDEVERYLRDLKIEENKKKYIELFNELGWKEHYDRWFGYGKQWDHLDKLWLDLEKFEPDEVREAAKKLKGEIYYSNLENANSVSFARKISKKDEKTKKKTKTELREEEMKKKQSQLEAARRDICDEYLNCIISIPEEKLEDVYSVKYLVVSRLWDQLEKLDSYITDFESVYGVKSNRKDFALLKETYKDFDLLQRVMLNMWRALASDYQNKFISSYNHMKCEKVLDAHQELYDILRKFGLRLDPEMEAVIDGTSELYLIDGKEVK